ncbi:MAG: arsenic resistance protein [Thaumarchaeota archaeon]|nr:arsenic resistance protein [Nitrososphaerota archaeon]
MVNAARIADHLKKYLIVYVILIILIALPIGYYNAGYFKAHKETIKNVILSLAIGTLLPSMIQLRSEKMGKELRSKLKEVIVAMVIIFIITPLLAILFASHIGNKVVIGIGYIAANSVPASSASVAYVMLAGGNIELATVLVILSILIALFAAPTYVALYAQSVHMNLPIIVLAESVVIALLLPLILGQIIRYCFITRRAEKLARASKGSLECTGKNVAGAKDRGARECLENKMMKKIKPYLSIWTITFMFALIGVLIANKAGLLISNPSLALYIITAQLVIYTTVILSVIIASKVLNIAYREHMAVAFISLTKNESVAATMAVLAIGPTAAVPAALIPAIQPLVATLYISMAHTVKRILGEPGNQQ